MTFVKIEFDQKQLKNVFGDELRKQINFATSQTLNQAAFDARRGVQTMLRRKLDIKKTFIPNSVVVEKSHKTRLVAVVGLLERARLLPLLEEGGTRYPFGNHIAIPVNAGTRTGKITKSHRPKALIAKGAFVSTIKGTHGIWMKKGRDKRIRLMYYLVKSTKFDRGTIRFYRTVQGVVPQSFKKNFGKNLERALANRKR